MNKFLKVLTFLGLSASLSVAGFKLTDLDLNKNTNIKKLCEIESSSNDLENQTQSDSDIDIAFSQDGENNITVNDNVHHNTMDEHLNPVLDTENNAQVAPISEENDLETTENQDTPTTLEETENNQVENGENTQNDSENIQEDNNNDTTNDSNTTDLDNSANINIENGDEIDEDTNSNLENQNSTSTYLSQEDFNQILSNYDELKEEIEELIADTTKIAENSQNGANLLSEEQKSQVQTRTDELNTLLVNLKENFKDLQCTLTGDCSNLDNEIKAYYFNEILKLNNKINMIQNAMQAYANPAFRFYQNPYGNIYGFSYTYTPNLESDNQSNEQSEDDIIQNEENEANSENDDNKKKTFNLPNNLDTYGPTRRNIDTFFNTALLDDNMLNNYGYYGYNMPYNNFGYNGYNNMNGYVMNGNMSSNYMNKEQLKENTAVNTPLNVESGEQTNNEPVIPEEIGKKRPRIAKNIDTYNTQTVKGNINSMSGMRVTDYLKQKFNKWFNKKENKKDLDNYVDNFIEEHENDEQNGDLVQTPYEQNSTPTAINDDSKIISKDHQNLYV